MHSFLSYRSAKRRQPLALLPALLLGLLVACQSESEAPQPAPAPAQVLQTSLAASLGATVVPTALPAPTQTFREAQVRSGRVHQMVPGGVLPIEVTANLPAGASRRLYLQVEGATGFLDVPMPVNNLILLTLPAELPAEPFTLVVALGVPGAQAIVTQPSTITVTRAIPATAPTLTLTPAQIPALSATVDQTSAPVSVDIAIDGITEDLHLIVPDPYEVTDNFGVWGATRELIPNSQGTIRETLQFRLRALPQAQTANRTAVLRLRGQAIAEWALQGQVGS